MRLWNRDNVRIQNCLSFFLALAVNKSFLGSMWMSASFLKFKTNLPWRFASLLQSVKEFATVTVGRGQKLFQQKPADSRCDMEPK